MRRFEVVLLIVELFAVVWPAVFGVRPRRGIVTLLLALSALAQIQWEGFRWQMIPLYMVALGLAVGDIVFLDRSLEWKNRIARGVFGITGLALAATLPVALPVPELPEPSGPETIGTVTVELVDVDREEIYGENPGSPRRFVVQVFYPARPVEGVDPVPWSEDLEVVAPALAESLGFPSWFLNHTRYVETHSYPGLPIARGSFPVVIYSHGWTGFRTVALNQMESLASSGYIVIAIDHTYGSVATKLGDEVIRWDPAALPEREEVGDKDYFEAAARLIDTYTKDIIAVLDALEEGETGPLSLLAGRADLNRVGIYGHSTGGGAAITVCLVDERCKAVLGMDPWVEPLPERILQISATRPALYMRSDGWRGTPNDAILRGIAGRSETITYWLGIEGAGHNDFVVTPLFSPFASSFGLKGPIPAGRVLPIIDNYLLGFFDVFLLGAGPAALDAVSFEEVSVEVIDPR